MSKLNIGKIKCEFMKKLRKAIASANHVEYEPTECNHQGECKGTCPACEKEANDLLDEIKKQNGNETPYVASINIDSSVDFIPWDDIIETRTAGMVSPRPMSGDVSYPFPFDTLEGDVHVPSDVEILAPTELSGKVSAAVLTPQFEPQGDITGDDWAPQEMGRIVEEPDTSLNVSTEDASKLHIRNHLLGCVIKDDLNNDEDKKD